jgi:hypothetical protein
MPLTLADFKGSRFGEPHLALLTAHPTFTARLLQILNDPVNEDRLVRAEARDLPALAGVVGVIEADSVLIGALKSPTSGKEFRLAVAVAVKLKMLSLGWSTNGRKGQVGDSRYFTTAERFKP